MEYIDFDYAYIICSTQRSGTHLLKHLLASQGLGFASEFKYKDDIRLPSLKDEFQDCNIWSRVIWYSHLEQLMGNLKKINQTDYGLRYGQLLYKLIPNVKLIYYSRKDVLRRSISFIKAEQSGEWNSKSLKPLKYRGLSTLNTDKFTDYCYDNMAILENIERCVATDQKWEEFFNRQRIIPLRVTYESVVESPETSLNEIMSFVGVPWSFSQNSLDDFKSEFGFPEKQSDHHTELWVSRFVSENPDFDNFDIGIGDIR